MMRHAAGTDLIPPLVLLQLSDLHFGPHSRFTGCDLERLAAQCRQALDEARGDLGWREAVGLVIVTGDIAEAARPPEYEDAAKFFHALAGQLDLSSRRFVFVPGNHDISWTQCRRIEGDLEDGKFPSSELRARLDEVKLTHFEKFIRDVHGGKARHEVDGASVTSLPHGVFLHDFADLGVSVAALNSCERESHRKEDHIGAMSAAQAQAVLDHWRRTPAELIRLVAVHHNPASMASPAIEQWLGFLRASPAPVDGVSPQLWLDYIERIRTTFVGFDGHEYLKRLAAYAHASLILHGHHHASASDQSWPWRGRDPGGPGQAHIVSAGSWGLSPESGKLPKDQPVVMQLIRLDPAAAEMQAVLLRYDPNASLAGDVRLGRFVLDPQTRSDRPLGLSLPPALRGRVRAKGAPERVADPRPGSRAPDVAAAVAAYRTRKTALYTGWDLHAAGPHPTVGHRPVEITLDEMYVPLRFDTELEPSKLDLGAPITADDLVQPRPPQVVIGGAGTGKTTWMRWTFRRLIRDPRALPFFLELRAIAKDWGAPKDAGRPIDSYLADALTTSGVSDAAAVVAAVLAGSSAPQVVLLIDGWDELGAQGERVRERLLEFCAAFPHVVVVVSSRPYGDTYPAGAEAFKTLYIQPLADDDVRLLATHFHRSVHDLDDEAGSRETDEFMAALAAAPDARSLAGTALLLTMMLLLSRKGPLPDQRHTLYTACLRNMLVDRADHRKRAGAILDDDQWHPSNSEERLRVVAEFAYAMQTEGYKKERRAPIVRAWEAAVDLLWAGKDHRTDPSEWTRDRCDRFLRWLVATAGVLVDRTDGSVHFAHLSFQEYLAAYHLHCTREGDERVAVVRDHMGDRGWWETLRLWAALTGDKGPDKLSTVLATLRADVAAYWLAGMIFADGTGQRSDFEAWATELGARLSSPFGVGDDDRCARAWGVCKQDDRRAVLTDRLNSVRESLCWLEASWHAVWCQHAILEVAPAPALRALETPLGSAGATARARVLFGGAASWPDGGELAVLRLWPSARGMVGIRLQTAISLGAQVPDVMAMLSAFVERETRPWSGGGRTLVEQVWYLSRYWGRSWDGYAGRNLEQGFVRIFRYLGQHFGDDLGWDFGRYLGRGFGPKLGRDLGRYLGRELGRDIVQDFGQYLGIAESMLAAHWLSSLAFLELGSIFGRALPRVALAHGEVHESAPLLDLFHSACRASFAPGDACLYATVDSACAAFDGDPLWPALARHVARISTDEDRALLEDLARHPEQRRSPLSWGLQYYVRGDLVFDDESVVTIDELCARAGLAPPPLLEPMPDEFDIPLDEAAP